MYLLTELILFSPLIVYACIRVRKLIPKPALKHFLYSFYILLFLGYPIAESLSHSEISGWARYLVIVGYYCLPYLLYFTLLVVTIDIVIALARIVKLLRTEIDIQPRISNHSPRLLPGHSSFDCICRSAKQQSPAGKRIFH